MHELTGRVRVQMHLATLEAAHIDLLTWNLPEAAEESDAMSMSSTSSHIGWGRAMRRAATAAGARSCYSSGFQNSNSRFYLQCVCKPVGERLSCWVINPGVYRHHHRCALGRQVGFELQSVF